MRHLCLSFVVLIAALLLLLNGCKQPVDSERICDFEEVYSKGKRFSTEGKVDSAIVYLNEALRCGTQADSNLQILLELGDLYRLQSEFLKAERMISLFDSTVKQFEKVDSALFAEKYHLKGKIFANRGSYLDALKNFNKSIELKNKLYGPLHTTHAKTYNFIGIVYLYQSQISSALDYFDSSLMVCNIHQYYGKDASDGYMNKGIVYSILGKYDQAITCFNQSRTIQEQQPEVYKDLGEFYINYGYFLKSIGESSESLRMYGKADSILRINENVKNLSISQLYNNIANTYYQRGDFEKARLYYSNVINSMKEIIDERHPNLLIVNNNLAIIHYILGEYSQALKLFYESLELAEMPENRVLLLRNLGKTLDAIGDIHKADSLFNVAVSESIDRFGNDHQETAVSYQSIGEFLQRNKMHSEAMSYFRGALKILEENYAIQKPTIGHVKVLLAKSLSATGKIMEAETIFLEAISGFDPESEQSFVNADVRIKEAFFGLAGLYHMLSTCSMDTVVMKKSLVNYLAGLKVVEKLGMTIADESKLILNQENKRRMTEALAVCHELFAATGNSDYIDLAFELSSKAKGAVLLSSIRHNKALEFGGVPIEVTLKENTLKEEISVVRKLLYNEKLKKQPSQAQMGYLENKLFVLDKQYDSLIEHIGNQYPSYYRLKYQNNLISVQQVQQKLGSNELLLDYVLHDSLSFLIALTKDEKYFVRLEGLPDAEMALKELLNYLKPDFSALNRRDYEQYIDVSYELYSFLIGPVKDLVSGKQLVIIPDGILGYIPFEVLLTKQPDSSEVIDYAGLPYLIRTNSLSYVYSATLRYLVEDDNKERQKGRVITFVPDYSVAHSLQIDNVDGEGHRQQLVALPYARAESKHVLSMVEGRELKGSDASKQNFISYANEFDVLHLAMHTQINDNNPLYSRLVFHPISDSPDNFTLSTYELYNLKLNASLVVLSACNTGSGNLQQGEGIMSLSRGFIYSGVPSIVMTTWEVHDESGSRLMERFYYYLREGLGKDEALRLAKIDFLDNSNRLKAHPYFWSSYVLIGNPDPIDLMPGSDDHILFYYLIPIGLLSVMTLFIFLIKKRRLPAPFGSRQND
jgi:CHAT domain-containing protein/Tfp pilus assembly protein PilF